MKLIFTILIFISVSIGTKAQSTTVCDASFSHNFVSDTSPFAVKFIDHSSMPASIVSWKWDFGDGSKLEFSKNPIHVYTNLGNYKVTLTTNAIDGSSSSYSADVLVNSIINPCIADFINISLGNNKIKFYDYSLPDGGINEWYWDFGDGDTSSVQNPSHIYTYAGIYDVKLQVSSDSCINQVILQVSVGDPKYYSLWGRVYVNNMTTDQCQAFLYRQFTNGYIKLVDTVNLTSTNDTLGIYYFYQVPEGDYMVSINIPNTSINDGDYAPTYFGDSPFWAQAQVIGLHSEQANMHVNMTPVVHQVGNNTISGHVDNNVDDIIDSILVLLYNNDNDLIDFTRTDTNGAYSFFDVPSGQLSVFGELIGYSSIPAQTPNIGNNENLTNVNFIIDHKTSTGIIEKPEIKDDFNFSIFPNPINDNKLSILFHDNHSNSYTYKIYSGIGVFKTSATINPVNNISTISVAYLQAGIYLLSIYDKNNLLLSTKKFIIY